MIFFMVVEGAPERERFRQPKIDEQLFARIGQDDHAALEELYNLTERALYSYVLAIVKNPYDTEDIVQETYIKIRACAHLYKPQGKPLAWMFTIARNLSMSMFRRQTYCEPLEEESLSRAGEFSYIEDPTDRIVLEAALSILKEQERQVILLHLVSGLKHRQIAAGMQLPLSTVLSCYSRALKKLKDHMKGKGITA